jgi:hypothetical protein
LRPKYRSNPPKAGQYTAGNVSLTTESSKDNLHQTLIL